MLEDVSEAIKGVYICVFTLQRGGNRSLCPQSVAQKKFAHKGGAVGVCNAHCVHARYAKQAHCTLSKGSSLHTKWEAVTLVKDVAL